MTLVKIGKAAEMLGVKPQTLLAWERSGELVPARRSQGGVRYYDLAKITGLSTGLSTGLGSGSEGMLTVGYARVFGPGKEVDLSPGKRNCWRPSVPPRAGGMRSSPTTPPQGSGRG
jgi:hypothetical protein